MDTLIRDIRYALRTLAANPVFTLVAVLALAVGVGANTAIFTLVDSILLRPLNYAHPDKLVVALHQGRNPVSPADYLDYERGVTVFEQLAAAQVWSANLTGQDRPAALSGLEVTSNLFPMLGVQPSVGRWFDAAEASHSSQVVILSHSLWQRQFNADPKLPGHAITLNGKPYTVVGIMPPDFRFAPFWATRSELWTLLDLRPRLNDRDGRSLRLFGRLKPGVSLQQAQTQMDSVASRLAATYPATNAKLGITVLPLAEKVVGPIRPTLLILLATVVLVLLIACANLANLLLTKAVEREREMHLRIALGAGQWRLARLLLTESLVIALLGGALGLMLASTGVHSLTQILPPGSMPRQEEIHLNPSMLLFTLAIAVLSGILAGVGPVLRLSGFELARGLRQGGRAGTESSRSLRVRAVLVAGEVALTMVLLSGAGLMIRTLLSLGHIDPGFEPNGLLTMQLSLQGTSLDTPARRPQFFQEIQSRLAQLPGVASASGINHLPIGGDLWKLGYTVIGRPAPPVGEGFGAVYRVVLPGYFNTMGITVLRGREFNETDRDGTPAVAIVNATMARRQWPNSSPIGQKIKYGLSPADQATPKTIIGVVADASQGSWAGARDDEVYLPYLQRTESMGLQEFSFVIRANVAPEALAPSVERTVGETGKDVPISHLLSMPQVIAADLWRSRLSALLLAIFGAIALALAAAGIYGVIAYTMERRTREIGIRMALGAHQSDVLRLVLIQGMTPVLAGAAIGLALALLSNRAMQSLLFEVHPGDPLTYACVSLLLATVAFLANYLPARRAARVDPLLALHHD